MPETADSEGTVPARPWGEAGPAVRFAAAIEPAAREELSAVLGRWDAGLFGVGEVAVSVLEGGANNRNYVVETGEAKYALRIATQMHDRFAVDRESAVKAQQATAAAGLAPVIYAFSLPAGDLLSEFLEGRDLLQLGEVADPEVLVEVGGHFRRLHAVAADVRDFSPFSDIRHWVALAKEDGTEAPADMGELLRRLDEVEALSAELDLPSVLCHNDTVPANFLRTPAGLKAVDWDYAGMGSACFELASFAATAGLDAGQQERLLLSYDGGTDAGQVDTVELFRFVAAMREVAWAVMALPILSGITDPGDEAIYQRHLEVNIAEARQRAADESFPDWLRGARRGLDTRRW